tara:strand:- start:1141 stop:1527 length:387 start_codon:yes stop_codon:yes gene_type:complete
MKKFEDQNHEDLEAFFLSAQRALPAPSDQLRDRVLQNAQALMARQGAEKSDSNGSDIGFLGGLSNFWSGLGGLKGWASLVVIAGLSFQFGGVAPEVEAQIYDMISGQNERVFESSDPFEDLYLTYLEG